MSRCDRLDVQTNLLSLTPSFNMHADGLTQFTAALACTFKDDPALFPLNLTGTQPWLSFFKPEIFMEQQLRSLLQGRGWWIPRRKLVFPPPSLPQIYIFLQKNGFPPFFPAAKELLWSTDLSGPCYQILPPMLRGRRPTWLKHAGEDWYQMRLYGCVPFILRIESAPLPCGFYLPSPPSPILICKM